MLQQAGEQAKNTRETLINAARTDQDRVPAHEKGVPKEVLDATQSLQQMVDKANQG